MDKNPNRVIVVDDELNQRTALAGIISRWGYEVKTAANGAEALTVLASFAADVVVTDLNMPGLDGKGLLEELQKLPSPPQAIVLTAYGSLETALEAIPRRGVPGTLMLVDALSLLEPGRGGLPVCRRRFSKGAEDHGDHDCIGRTEEPQKNLRDG